MPGPAAGFALSTMLDDFKDNNLDGNIWFNNSYGTLAETGGAAVITCDTAFNAYSTQSIYTFDTTPEYQMFPPALASATVTCYLGLFITSAAQASGTDICILCDMVAGQIQFLNRVGFSDGSPVTATYSAVTHAWWKIIRSGGNILFQTATDNSGVPNAFTTRRTLATPAWLTSPADVAMRMESNRNNGTNNTCSVKRVQNNSYNAVRTKNMMGFVMS